MTELLAGVFVAVAALALVLEPLVRGRAGSVPPLTAIDPSLGTLDLVEPGESDSPKIQALHALREIEFDKATGKLSDHDYAVLKARYSKQAVQALEAEGRAERGDPAEEAVGRARGAAGAVCPSCGPRPEPIAAFCSSCGRPLHRPDALPRCRSCGSDLPEGARFCSACGVSAAA
ncbi:MAG: zinc ribbon domain-containing protein [Gemmatimonadales bacterium]